MSADLAIGVSAASAIAAGASAFLAVWSTRESPAFSRRVDFAFRRSLERASSRPEYDVFLSYSSQDSKRFAEELAEALHRLEVRVWFDEEQIDVGDNAYEKLGEGLSASRYAVVILSPHFFDHAWASRELDALSQLEREERSLVLPIWHEVSEEEVQRFVPDLALKRALRSDNESVEEIAADVARVVHSGG